MKEGVNVELLRHLTEELLQSLMVSKMYRLFSGIYTVSSINNGILTLKIFEWSLVCSSPARIGGRASYIVGTDKEARAANSDASLLGSKRARPIAISTGGFFS